MAQFGNKTALKKKKINSTEIKKQRKIGWKKVQHVRNFKKRGGKSSN